MNIDLLAEAARAAVAGVLITTMAGTVWCQVCDANTDPGSHEDGCPIGRLVALLEAGQ